MNNWPERIDTTTPLTGNGVQNVSRDAYERGWNSCLDQCTKALGEGCNINITWLELAVFLCELDYGEQSAGMMWHQGERIQKRYRREAKAIIKRFAPNGGRGE